MTPHLQGGTTRMTGDFSSQTLEATRKLHNIFQVLKEKNYQPSILYPAKSCSRQKREIKYSYMKKN
jgi:hypothetical protein